jgi:hypothetical protein
VPIGGRSESCELLLLLLRLLLRLLLLRLLRGQLEEASLKM